ncbi:SpoIIE family protein phosphatase [Streptomyces sp. MNU89]|uniref:SpoIIE family protein phosphatase n=1 Tax=Streptomyces sp. MNU89 TaxID=2560025 RepID=UPI001E5B5844|nr:SpoIIE family protein phosphatase [Streptomyces sp. MNU89]MCC9742492.1 SpoIIE family protein phosphatase [Streptomyces sp. MNU89]
MTVEPELVPSPVDPSWAGVVISLLSRTSASGLLTLAKEAALAAVGSRAGAVYIRQDDGRLRLATTTGYGEYIVERYGSVDADADLPAAEAARERRLVWRPTREYSGLGSDAARFPSPSAYASVPLMLEDRCLAVLSLQLDRREPLSESEERTLSLIAAVAAQRLEYLLSRETKVLTAGVPRLDQAVRLVESRTRAARLELAMASADIGAFDWDFASGRLVWDERTCRLFGVESDTFDERIDTFYAHIHPEDRAAVHAAARTSMRTGFYSALYRIIRPDGVVRWIDAKASVVRDAEGNPQGMVGVAQDRTEEREHEERRHARREFVLNLTAAFGAALSTQDVVDTMTGTVLPALDAKALAIHLVQDGDVVLAGAAGYPEEVLRRLEESSMGQADSPMSAALRAGSPLFFESREEFLAAFPDESFRPAVRHHAWALLPLTTADGTVGTCILSYADPRVFTPDDQIVTTAIAGILAQSLARARLFDQRRQAMTELQRVMLPRSLPRLPGVEVAVRYQPGSEGLDVGGDWYDVVRLPGGKVGLMIGDVQGHSAQAAAVMGQLRTALLAYADDGHGPADLMACGNRMLCGLDTELFATCCIVELDPATGALRMARAGHPYPLLLEADGTVRELAGPGGLPLACQLDDEYPVVTAELPRGATLLLYTDGLVESREHSYDEGVAELVRSLSRWAADAGPESGGGPESDRGPDGEWAGPEARAARDGGLARHGPVRGAPSGARDRTDLDVLADRIAAPAAGRTAQDDIAVLLVRRTD